MKIALISDTHFEFKAQTPIALEEDVDVLFLAGDIDSAARVGARALEIGNGRAELIVHVAGNHEYYGTRIDKGRTAMRASPPGVVFLDNSSVVVDGWTILGTTLWTDYNLSGRQPLDMLRAQDYMNDHRRIKFFDGGTYRRFQPRDALVEHQKARSFLREELERSDKTIIMTHHAPSWGSIHEKYYRNEMNSAYASDLTDLMLEYEPAYWFHGHMHDPCDYMIGNTRVIANPHGYPRENENPQILVMNV